MMGDLSAPAAPTVLVISDQPEMAAQLCGYLAMDGFQALTALSGEQARDLLAATPPDLVLVDSALRDAGAFTLCAHIRSLPRRLPLLLAIAPEDPAQRTRGTQAGCDEFLTKPVARDELRARVRSLLKMQATRDAMKTSEPAAGPPDTGSRQDAVVLLAALTGFDRALAKLAPPDVMGILNACTALLLSVAQRHGGAIFNVTGNSVMAAFGLSPQASGDEQAALAAGRDMILEAVPLMQGWKRRFELELGLAVGASRGSVITGHLSVSDDARLQVVGDPVVGAARLARQAQPGEIVCAESLRPWAQAMRELLGEERLCESATLKAYGYRPLAGKPPPRVLLVDDAPDFRALARKFITIEWPQAQVTEYDPIQQGRPPAGFDWSRFDAVLLDFMIGHEDGLVWLRELRAVPGVPPIIFMTGSGSESVAANAIKLGAAEYLSKYDLSRRRLADAITEVMSQSRAAVADPQSEAAAEFVVPAGSRGFEKIAIGGYRVVRCLGEGGMAVVYLAHHLESTQERVLKILDRRASSDDNFLGRFFQEYGVVSRISSPHVIQIHDQGMTADHAYIAMEYIKGGSLKERLGRGLAPEAAMQIFRQLLAALKAVHAAGVVHRDLKPHNIMFRADGTLVLLDFGIAKEMAVDLALTQVGTVIGTPLYMSPEQSEGSTVDYRSDLYSAGVILYEMLTGELPYRSDSIAGLIQMHRGAPIPQLPRELHDYQILISRLMAKSPAERYQSAAELLPEGP